MTKSENRRRPKRGGQNFLVVLMTSPNEAEARRIAEALVKQRKAACVSIFPKGTSVFWWEGKIDRAEEFLLIAKTVPVRLNELIRVVKSIHSYQVPEIIALPLIGGNKDYLKWLGKEAGRDR